MKKIFLLIIPLMVGLIYLAVAGLGQEAHGLTMSVGSGGNREGVQIYVKTNFTLLNVTKVSSVTANLSSVYNGSGSLLAVSPFVNNVANFSINLVAGQNYTIEANQTNVAITSNACNNIATTRPVNGTSLDWINGTFNGVVGANGEVFCNIESITYFNNLLGANVSSFNASTYETATESFISNFTLSNEPSTVSLLYGSTTYAGTVNNLGGNNYRFSRTLDIPEGSSAINWRWNITFTNGSTQLTNPLVQSRGLINLTQCTAPPQNIAFFNYTFKDEDTLNTINATLDSASFNYYLGTGTVNKSLSLGSTQSQNNIGFCFTPPDRTLNVLGSVRYSNLTLYPQRFYDFLSSFTNSTTLTTLYLLSSNNGIYTSIQTSESTGAAISGVELTVERSINNAWVIIGQQTTGSDGLATFFVNPNYEHRITAEKSGYVTAQVIITPSQSTYTLVMTRDSGSATYNGSLAGIVWKTYPAVGPISPGTYNFQFNLTASLGNLDGSFCKMELINAITDASLTSTTGGSSNGCNLSFNYALDENVKYRAIYRIDLTNTDGFVIIDNDAYWFTINPNATNSLNIKSFFQDFRELPEFGTGLRAEFSRTIAFFFILVCLLAILCYTSGYDFANPGWAMIIVLAPVAIASSVGFFQFTGLSTSDWVEKYSVMMIMIFMIAGFVMSYIGRNS